MANPRVCPHTITVFNHVGKDESRRDIFQATVIAGVHVFHQEGQISNDAANDALRVHIFDDCASPSSQRSFIDYKAFSNLEKLERYFYWTLSPDGHDYIAEGEQDTDENGYLPEGITLYRIKKIGRREMGTERMHHWKVEAI